MGQRRAGLALPEQQLDEFAPERQAASSRVALPAAVQRALVVTHRFLAIAVPGFEPGQVGAHVRRVGLARPPTQQQLARGVDTAIGGEGLGQGARIRPVVGLSA